MLLKTIFRAMVFAVMAASATAWAAQPKDITYKSKGNTLMGGDYYTYAVYCSDGKNRVISAWDGKKQWCLGTSKDKCTSDQLSTAKKACE